MRFKRAQPETGRGMFVMCYVVLPPQPSSSPPRPPAVGVGLCGLYDLYDLCCHHSSRPKQRADNREQREIETGTHLESDLHLGQ